MSQFASKNVPWNILTQHLRVKDTSPSPHFDRLCAGQRRRAKWHQSPDETENVGRDTVKPCKSQPENSARQNLIVFLKFLS